MKLQTYLWPATALLIALAFAIPAFGQGLITDNAMAQIGALQQEKAARSPAERKLDSQFIFQLKQNRGVAVAAGVTQLKPDVEFERDGRVLVDMDATVTTNLLVQVQQAGGTVINSFPQFHAIRALVPLEQLESLAASGDVKFIKRAAKAVTNAGAVTSEGDVTHRAGFARNNFAVTGRGIRVGVLSDSVDYLSNSQQSGDLGEVTVLPGQAGSGAGEGTAMLEIIHDLAPDAPLYFATAFNSEASFAQNILDLRSNGCDIIVDDVYYYDEPPFQDGLIAQAVNRVTADGAMYFSAAGNDGNFKDSTSGTWEGDFVDSGQPLPAALRNAGYGGKVHSFGLTNYDAVISGGQGIDLFWSDPAGASTNDYDLFVLDATGSYLVAASVNPQTGTQDPYERINVIPGQNSRIVIVKASGAPRFLHLVTSRGNLSVATGGATRGHSAATNSFSVAAVNAMRSFPGPFAGGGANPVETFSSDGPRRVFFNADGSPITPGNFAATGGTLRQKPDLAAADGVMTTVPYSFQPFFGTSAAAPHAAAIAALLLSYDRTLAPGQIRAALMNTTLDIEAPGFDSNSGAGIVMAEQALETLTPKPVLAAGSATVVNESYPDGAIEPGETVTVALSLVNIGVAGTSNLVATLLNTGGVTYASAPQSYGVLPAHGGAVSQEFTFIATGNYGGQEVVTLQLQDGAMNLGTVSFVFPLGVLRNPLVENFDSVTPPNLPAGWSTASSGAGGPWQTTTNYYNCCYDGATAPNSVVITDPGTNSDKSLISPQFHIYSASAQVSFGQDGSYMASGYSGGVLEISTNGGPFQDIIDAGGSFVLNGYNTTIYGSQGNPLGDFRAVWSGSGGTTIVTLPASAAGRDVRLRWRFATGQYSYGAPYRWYIDTIQVTDGYNIYVPTQDNVVVGVSGAPNPVVLKGNLTYTINIENTGPDTATGVKVTDLLPANFTLQSVTLSDGIYPGPGLNGGGTISFNIGTLAGGSTATITLAGTVDAMGLMTNRVSISRTDGGLISSSNATVVTPVVLPTVSIGDVTVMEDSTNAVFNVNLTPGPATNTYVRFATTNVTALAGTNYVGTNGLLTFVPGLTNQTITVRMIDDLIDAPDKSFAVNLFGPTNAVISKSQGVGTVINVDPPPYLSVSDATVARPNSGTTNAVFNFRLSRPSGYSVAFDYATSDGSAVGYTNGSGYGGYLDYVPTNGYSLTFAPGQTNLSVRVLVTSHVSVKPSQNFYMQLSDVSYAKILRGTGIGSVLTALPGRLDHFSWDSIASPQSNGLPFVATVRARDFFEGIATNFSGAAALSGFVVNSYRTNTFFGDLFANGSSYGGPLTWGYSFTPKTNMTVTHLRGFQSDKVSLWTEDGTLLASQYITNTYGWSEAPLANAVQLQAGHSYRLGAYTVGYYGNNLEYGLGTDYPDVALGQDYVEVGESFPDVPEPGVASLVDIRYTVGVPAPLPVTPINSGNFTNNSWSGLVTVQLPAINLALMASDGAGHVGFSSPFNVAPTPGYATYFAWSPFASPQPISNYFSATITAKDYFNNTASNFTGSVAISASVPVTGTRTNTLLGNTNALYNYYITEETLGYAFTPRTNLTVTHVRYYFGSMISIWATNGTLLISTNVASTPGTWKETALSTPLQLSAGQTYVIGAYTPSSGNNVFYRDDLSTNFADGIINHECEGYGSGLPTSYFDGPKWYFVDIRYTVTTLTNTPVVVSPANSGTFIGGIWSSGNFLVNRFATNLTLLASDGIGHTGLSNPFDVNYVAGVLDHFSWNAIVSPQTNAAPFAASITALDHYNGVATNFNGPVTLTVTGVPANPFLAPQSGNFNQGLWTGSITLMPAASNVVLRVTDGLSRTAASSPFNLVDPPLLPPLLQNTYFGSNTFQFGWSAVPGHMYQVQYKTNLSQTNWINLGSPINATNVNPWLSAPAGSEPQRFFRIQMQ